MKRLSFQVLSKKAPSIEIDQAAAAAYVRFKNIAKVDRTIELSSRALVDLDKLGEVIGVELLALNEFSVSIIVKQLVQNNVTSPHVDWNKARFMSPKRCVDTEPEFA